MVPYAHQFDGDKFIPIYPNCESASVLCKANLVRTSLSPFFAVYRRDMTMKKERSLPNYSFVFPEQHRNAEYALFLLHQGFLNLGGEGAWGRSRRSVEGPWKIKYII